MKRHRKVPKEEPFPQNPSTRDVCQLLHTRPADAHKGTMGHALLVAGSRGMAGAAILSARSCLHSGIGKLTVHTPGANNVILQCSVPEAILHPDPDDAHLSQYTPTDKFQAVGIGPGIGTDETTAEALHRYLTNCKAPMVLDADALNIIASHPGWDNLIPAQTIITPHVGEFGRLTHPCDSPEERLELAQTYAREHHIYVVLKGHPSQICSPDGEVLSCPYGNSGMATPGSGDVLTGLVTGLLAQGYPPREASILGVWLHARSGDFAAQRLGEEYMLAGDIVTHLSPAFHELWEERDEAEGYHLPF